MRTIRHRITGPQIYRKNCFFAFWNQNGIILMKEKNNYQIKPQQYLINIRHEENNKLKGINTNFVIL